MAGVKGRSGRRPALQAIKLQSLLDDAWPAKKRYEVVERLHAEAMIGNVEAAKVLLFMCYGRPAQRHEISGPDGAAIPVEHDPLDAILDRISRRPRPDDAPDLVN